MLIGSYERKSFILPKIFLKELSGESCILAIPVFLKEKCIVIFPFLRSPIAALGDFSILCGAEFSQNGEILIPKEAKRKISEYFKIKKGEVLVFAGCLNRVEIWKKEEWEQIQEYPYEKVLERVLYSKGGENP